MNFTHHDYGRITDAIEYLRANAAAQPDLAAIARHVGLGEHHFQRLFTRWAGVSPKRFLQFLTIEDAKRRLAETRNTLDLSADIGLSGTGRLHDLFITLEALTPGEARTGGAGLIIRWGLHDTPFGRVVIGITDRGVCALHFVDDQQHAAELLHQAWPHATLRHEPVATAKTAGRIFTPIAQRTHEPLAVLVKGSNFQIQVWRALLALPAGALATYSDIAAVLDKPDAARAVGSAVAANSIAYLIPCHRVIRASGALSGYRWGSARKTAILGWEAARSAGGQR